MTSSRRDDNEEQVSAVTFENPWDLMDNASIAIHLVDSSGIIRYANKAELAMLGYSRNEYIGKHISDFHADSHTICDIMQKLSRFETLHNYRARLLCKDGSVRWGSIESSVYCTADGRFCHTRCFTRDVTDLIAAQERMKLQEIELLEQEARRNSAEQLSSQCSAFLRTVVHEWKNPLAGVLGAIQLIEDDLEECARSFGSTDGASLQSLRSTIQKSIDCIRFSVDQQQRVSEDVLSWSRMRSNKLEIVQCPLDLMGLLKQLRLFFECETRLRFLQSNKVRFFANVSDDTMEALHIITQQFHILGDERRLQQVLMNLVQNALKFTTSGSVILDFHFSYIRFDFACNLPSVRFWDWSLTG
eukprot:ANDGO_01174.mRNA.1 Cell-division control histidine kinase PdhS